MNSILLKEAVALVPETELLVNMVRLRIRQLVRGSRALIVAPPGMGLADIALSEIAAGKITSESTLEPAVLAFPGAAPLEKAA